MAEERQRRQALQSLRRSMQLFDHKLALHQLQRMQLPEPLPDSWQLVPTGSAATLPVRRHPHSPLGSPFRTL